MNHHVTHDRQRGDTIRAPGTFVIAQVAWFSKPEKCHDRIRNGYLRAAEAPWPAQPPTRRD